MPLIKDPKQSPDSFNKVGENKNNQSTVAKEEKSLVNIVGSLLPLAPVLFEQWTGQKIPPMTGTLAEMNTAVAAMQLSLSQILQNQQQLWNRLEALEKNASSQLTSLGQQFQSLRLTHTHEKRQIEYNRPEE